MSSSAPTTSRRSFLGLLGGLIAVPTFGFQAVGTFLRSMWPNVLYEPPKSFKIGPPKNFTNGVSMIPDKRLFVINENGKFHVISAVCEHLGCTVNKVDTPPNKVKTEFRGKAMEFEQTYEFHCACHGSKYRGDGTNYAGPTPRPLKWFELEVAPDGELVVNSSTDLTHDYGFSPPQAS